MSQADARRRMAQASIDLQIDETRLWSFGSSESAWVFNPSGMPIGKFWDEMMRNFEARRHREFLSHVCADHPRNTSAKS
jgi:hypothetical protein